MKTTILAFILVLFSQSACSIYKAATQPPPADLNGIGIGTPRQELIMRIGVPKMSETDKDGHKQDTFEFYSGMDSVSKIRVIPYIAADLFTLTLAELILWPMELTLMDKATCQGYAVYDADNKVQEWKVAQKDGVQCC